MGGQVSIEEVVAGSSFALVTKTKKHRSGVSDLSDTCSAGREGGDLVLCDLLQVLSNDLCYTIVSGILWANAYWECGSRGIVSLVL